MSGYNSNTSNVKMKLKHLHLEGSVPLFIPEKLALKIRYLCITKSQVEWSGPIWYTVEGSIENMLTEEKDFKITIRDMLLMDIGTGGATSFSYDEDIVNYMIDHPELEDMTMGHIHSHNNMGVFFSGTDMDELSDNTPNHNYYLSVIVNNNLDVKAKIAFTAQPLGFSCKDENGKEYTVTLSSGGPEPLMFIYDCKPEIELEVPEIDKEFVERIKFVEEKLNTLKAKKEKEEKEKKEKEEKERQEKGYGSWNNNMKALPPSSQGSGQYSGPAKDWGNHDAYKRNLGGYPPTQKELEFHNKNNGKNKGSEDSRSYSPRKATVAEQFGCYVVRLGNDVTEDYLDDALEDMYNARVGKDSVYDAVFDNLEEWYAEFFQHTPAYQSDEKFLDTMELVLGYLKTHAKLYEKLVETYTEAITSVSLIKENNIKNNKGQKV